MRKLMNVRSTLRRKSVLVAAGGVAVVALSGTAAFAYWTTSGTGTGTAANATGGTAVKVVQVGGITGLVPGGAAQSVGFKINNPATTPQYVTAVTVSIDSVSNAACTVDNFDLAQTTVPVGKDLASGDSATFTGPTIALKDLSTNQDVCKNVTVNLAFTAS